MMLFTTSMDNEMASDANYVMDLDKTYKDDLKLTFFYAGNPYKDMLSISYCEITLSELPQGERKQAKYIKEKAKLALKAIDGD